MEQRTCNIIMVCKNNCKYTEEAKTLVDAVKIYMGKECVYPWKDYTEGQIKSILLEALYDFINGASNPGFELRQLFSDSVFFPDDLSERICLMFAQTQVRDGVNYVNGFTESLIKQSDIDMGISDDQEIQCLMDEDRKVSYPCSRACPLFGDCVTKWYGRSKNKTN